MGLTDKFYAIVAAALLLLSLGSFAEQEIKLRHELSVLNKSLDNEIQCRVGSTCATKLAAEAANGALMVEQAQKAAATALASQKAEMDKQSADAVRSAQAAEAQVQSQDLAWRKKYNQSLQSPDCGAWAKQAVMCAVH